MVNYITLTQENTDIFYFNEYDDSTPTHYFEDDPSYLVDGYVSTFAQEWHTCVAGCVDEVPMEEWCTGNSCPSDFSDREITKVELRVYSNANKQNCTGTVESALKPVFPGGVGDEHAWEPPCGTVDIQTTANWSSWFDITSDTNAPGTWTWSNVNALDARHYPIINSGACGDLYLLESAKIEIRVTSLSECSLIAPEEVSTDHVQNVKMMNLWNGNRVVFGQSRNKWSLMLKGQDWETAACDRILCIKELGLAGEPITLSGLNNINWDGEWLIKAFGWDLVYESPIHYKWILMLEKT